MAKKSTKATKPAETKNAKSAKNTSASKPAEAKPAKNAKKSISLLIAVHKPYPTPTDPLYVPLQVGAALHDKIPDFTPDDSGDNISKKNPNFCELTGLYWGWKNLDSDYLGLVHYRRYFAVKKVYKKIDPKNEDPKILNQKIEDKLTHVLSEPELRKILKNSNVILPKRRKYYIETLYDHYAHTMHVEPLDETRKILESKYPDYLNAFDRLKTRSSAHMFNMFIFPRPLLDSYCTWLFDILFELENRLESSKIVKDYSPFHQRFYGRISELLLDVYLETHRIISPSGADLDPHYRVAELPIMNIETINWLTKGSSFLAAKLKGKKYDQSF